MNPCLASMVSSRYVSFAEREDVALYKVPGLGVRAIAYKIGGTLRRSQVAQQQGNRGSSQHWRILPTDRNV